MPTQAPKTVECRESDWEPGLYYYRARYYDPTVGRFVSSDPIGFGGMTSNFYAYVANDPQDSWILSVYEL